MECTSLCDCCCCKCVPYRPTVEPTNLLKTLAEQDTNFEAYLKLAQHQDHPNETESQVSSEVALLVTGARCVVLLC
jgi:L-lysine 2,3-aminomutase